MLSRSKYLRISLTNRCNLSCFYCHKEGNLGNESSDLTSDEVIKTCKIALEFGFKKFKLTGGEPTLNSDILEIVAGISELNVPDLSMITNGTLLPKMAKPLWDAGLRRMNITMNTLNQDRFRKIQRSYKNSVLSVMKGIDVAQEVGFKNIKLNFVFFDDNSERDLDELLDYCARNNLTLVILPVISDSTHYSLNYIYQLMIKRGISEESQFSDAEGIQKKLIISKYGAHVILRVDELSDLHPYSFCQDCTHQRVCREGIFPIRLSAQRELIPCMASSTHRVSIKHLLQTNDMDGLRQVFSEIESWYCV